MPQLLEVIIPFLAFGSQTKDPVYIDNFTFRLHYRFTSSALFMSTAILSLNNFFGKEIQCFSQNDQKSEDAVDQFCFVTGTFTIPSREGGECLVEDGWRDKRWQQEHCKVVHNYYQWVPYILVLQGVLFLLPHLLWRSLEGGRLGVMVREIRIDRVQEKSAVSRRTIIRNIGAFIRQQRMRGYVLSFIFCHFLTVLNVIVNITILNAFFGGRFIGHGHELEGFGIRWLRATDYFHALPDVFPRVTGCMWKEYGQGGEVQVSQHICHLAANVATEKVFIFLWFWYLILLPVSLASFLYYAVIFIMRDKARIEARLRLPREARPCQEAGACEEAGARGQEWDSWITKMSPGQFLLLHLLAGNLDPQTMLNLVMEASTVSEPGRQGQGAGACPKASAPPFMD